MSVFTVTPFKQGEPKTFTTLLCDGYHLSKPPSFRTLIDVFNEKAALHPDAHLLATLDDFDQASYTSGHATDKHKLDDTDGYDLSSVDPAVFTDGEHSGYLTTKSEFFIRRGNLMKKAAATTFADARGKLNWGLDDYDLDFFSLNTRPDEVIDGEIYIQIAPVARACETICAFPNGYFHGDLTPMEVFAVAQRFEERYRYALFGVGASYLGFLRRDDLPQAAARDFAEDILSLHSERQPPDVAARVALVLGNSDFVLFNYTAG